MGLQKDATGFFCLLASTLFAIVLVGPVKAQTFNLTADVLVNSSNTAGYNTDSASPGEYQRSLERYLEHLQIPYQVIDTATQAPPADLGLTQLIVAAHTGLSLSTDWQKAILAAVQAGSGFVNFDADPGIGSNLHMQGIFGATGSHVGPAGTSIVVPSSVMPDGSAPHYIAALQLRFPDTPAGNLVYQFHKDDNGVQNYATPTILDGASGTILASVGSSPLILATQTSGGRAVDFTTYDFMRPDRFGFMMGIDDLVWRSLVWAARKPFVLRGYPHLWASQMDDDLTGWGTRLQYFWNTQFTGSVQADGTGGPWKINTNAFLNNLVPSTSDRTNAIADVNNGFLKLSFLAISGISEGDLYWNPGSSQPLTDAQWSANLATAEQVMAGNGGSDTLPPLSKSMVPSYWNLSNNVGYDLWNTLGTRYITEIQVPGAYYNYLPRTSAMRIRLRPFRIYELPPTGNDPDELYPLYYADFMTVGSTAAQNQPVKFFFFATQLLGSQFPGPDARWPNDSTGITVQQSVDNFDEYTWRFWSSMAPVQIYNHDAGSFASSTPAEAQAAITQISTFLNDHGVIHVFMDDEGAYMCARTRSTLLTAQSDPLNLTVNFSGSATDMDDNPTPTQFYVYYRDDEGTQQSVPGFTNGYTYTIPNPAPPAIGLSNSELTFVALAGSPAVTQTVSVMNTGSGSLQYTVQSNAAWLTATPGTSTMPDSLTIAANPAGLAPGVYSGTIQVSASGAINSPQSISVVFTIQNVLTPLPGSFEFNAAWASTPPASQNLAISSSASGLVFTVTSDSTWLSTPASGVTPASLSISVNQTGLLPGTYTGHLTIASPGAVNASTTLAVTMTVTPPAAILMQPPLETLDGWAFSPLGLSSGWSASGGLLAYTPNGGGETQLYAGDSGWSTYSAQTDILLSTMTDYPGGLRVYVNSATGASYAAWLYPAEGVIKLWRTTNWKIDSSSTVLLGTSSKLAMDTTNWHTLAIYVSAGQIGVLFDGNTVVTAADNTLTSGMIALDVSNQPVQFRNVSVAGNQAMSTQMSASPVSLTFSVTAGTTSAAQTLTIKTSDGSLAAWSASSASNWLLVSPAAGSTATGGSVTIDASNLAVGSYQSQINVTSLGVTNSPMAIPVSVNVTAPVPDFSLAETSTKLTVARGQSGTETITITPVNGYDQTIAFTCSGLPSETSCSFSPSTIVPAGAPITTQLTITTTASSSALLRTTPAPLRPSGRGPAAFAILVLLGMLPLRRHRRSATRFLALLLCLSACALLASCGGGGAAGSNSGPSNPGTPVGASQVTITASGGTGASATQHTVSLALTVTN